MSDGIAGIADFLDDLPSLLRAARKIHGASLRQVARETGVSFSTVSRAEAGEDLALSTACALLRWIGRSS